MKTGQPRKSWLRIVKEIEAREPEVLTKEYVKEYLNAIDWLLMYRISKEDAARYYTTPDSIVREYEQKYKEVKRYIKEHFDPNYGEF